MGYPEMSDLKLDEANWITVDTIQSWTNTFGMAWPQKYETNFILWNGVFIVDSQNGIMKWIHLQFSSMTMKFMELFQGEEVCVVDEDTAGRGDRQHLGVQLLHLSVTNHLKRTT